VFAPGVTEESTDFCGFLVAPDLAGFVEPTARAPARHAARPAFYRGSEGPDTVVDFDEATTLTAIRWLEREGAAGPWAMWVPLVFPHVPFMVEEPWFSMHDRASMPDPIDAVDAGGGKPAFVGRLSARPTDGTSCRPTTCVRSPRPITGW
jgi:hypothetical protein